MNRYTCYALIIFLSLFLLTACANTRRIGVGGVGWSYGKFCGPGEPNVRNLSKEQAIRELESILPDDDIDAACKEHDLCYAKYSYFNYDCDKTLIKRLTKMRFRGRYSMKCTNVKLQVLAPFTGITPALCSSPMHLLASIITLPVRLLYTAEATALSTVLSSGKVPLKAGKCKSVSLHY